MVPGEQGWSVGVAGKGNQSHGVHLSRLSTGHGLLRITVTSTRARVSAFFWVLLLCWSRNSFQYFANYIATELASFESCRFYFMLIIKTTS